MKTNLFSLILIFAAATLMNTPAAIADNPAEKNASLRVLNFQGNNGFSHKSMDEGAMLLQKLSEKNNWELVESVDETSFSIGELLAFDVVVFNNI